MIIILSERWPIKMWVKEIEDGALAQARNLANLPFVHGWVAIMPDAHQGFGMPIGGVVALKDHIIPNAVGVDIGCGVCAVKTTLQGIEMPMLKSILATIYREIPRGFSHHKVRQDEKLMPSIKDFKQYKVVKDEYESALYQLGTLGGGNHFIEIQKGSDEHIWIMIHSGSRNFGKKVADYYNKLAIKMHHHPEIPHSWQLAPLALNSSEGQAYLGEMTYCVDFAYQNRRLMLERVKHIFSSFLTCSFHPMINIAHNYASSETFNGIRVMVHRKGATQARLGEIGIVPGSMGTASYIVEGLGNSESFNSCSHGAGRKMGRKEAIRSLNLKIEQAKMKHILGRPSTQEELEEAPGAYKDIDEVMECQKDLVRSLIRLEPLAVVKG